MDRGEASHGVADHDCGTIDHVIERLEQPVADRASSQIFRNLGKTVGRKIWRDDALYITLQAKDQREVMSTSSAEAVQDHHRRQVASTADVEQVNTTDVGADPTAAVPRHADDGGRQTIAQVTQSAFSSEESKAYDRFGRMGIVKGGEAKPEKSRLLRWL